MFLKVLANWHENGRIWKIWILAQTSNSGCIHLPLLLQFYSGQEGLPQNSNPLRFNWHNTDLNTRWRTETVLLTLLPKWHRRHSDMTGDGHLTCTFSYVCVIVSEWCECKIRPAGGVREHLTELRQSKHITVYFAFSMQIVQVQVIYINVDLATISWM